MRNRKNTPSLVILDFLSIITVTLLTWVFIRIIGTVDIEWTFGSVMKFILYFIIFFGYPAAVITLNHIRVNEKRLLINIISLVYLVAVIIRSVNIGITQPTDDLEVYMFLIIFAILPILILIFNNRASDNPVETK